MADSAMIREIATEFECPVCKEYMKAPIRICQRGHSFCNNCFSKVEVCPLCKGAKTAARCFALENVSEQLAFPCKYHQDGCKVTLNHTKMEEHTFKCDYRDILCPADLHCKWNDKITDLEFHIKDKHMTLFFEKSGPPLERSMNLEKSCLIFAKVHNEMFVLYRGPEKNTMRFSLYHFGKAENTNKFCLKFNIGDSIMSQIPCQPSQLFYEGDIILGIMIPLDQLKQFTNTLELGYVFEIIQVPLDVV